LIWRNGRGFGTGDSGPLYVTPGGGGGGVVTNFVRNQGLIGTNGDTWIGLSAPPPGGVLVSAPAQAGLAAGFSDVLLPPASIDVYYNNALCHYTAGVPASINQWTWVAGGGPPIKVVQIGAGSLVGDMVTVKYPI